MGVEDLQRARQDRRAAGVEVADRSASVGVRAAEDDLAAAGAVDYRNWPWPVRAYPSPQMHALLLSQRV